ncbi:MAG: hypothetical protein Q7S19_01190 [bacterium]|nr:hypothetical protein [bacterium]
MHLLDQQLAASIRGDFETAWKLCEDMWQREPHNDRLAFNRGWHIMAQGDLQEGMRLIDRGRQISVFGSKPLPSLKPHYDPSRHSLVGKTVLFRSEGGLGDEIINARFANDFAERGAKVIVSCDPGLAPVFARMKGVGAVIQSGQELAAYHDYWVAGMSAVLHLGHTYQTLPSKPFLTPDDNMFSLWRGIVKGDNFKVGIRWSGNPQFEHEQNRRFDPTGIFELSNISGVKLYSFQRDSDLRQLPSSVTDLQLFLDSWEDTAASLSHMDLVITSCTSVAHMSAALGKETWVIVPILPYYIWAIPGDSSPWYDNVRLFRQTQFGDWTEPLVRIRQELIKKLALNR